MHLVLILLKKQQIKKIKLQSLPETSKKEKRPSRPVQSIKYLQSQIPCTHFSTTLFFSLFLFYWAGGLKSGNFSHIIKTGLPNMSYH